MSSGSLLMNDVPDGSVATRFQTEDYIKAMIGTIDFGDVTIGPEIVTKVFHRCQELATQGVTFDEAQASFILLVLEEFGLELAQFKCLSGQVTVSFGEDRESICDATIKVDTGVDEPKHVAYEDATPVRALNGALQKVVVSLADGITLGNVVKERIPTSDGAPEVYRATITLENCTDTWTSVGVGPNLIEAFIKALLDGYRYAAYRHNLP
ncbi:MAG: hypothetical protein CMI53_05420 [Parcubacteria group bacterium]|jgi:2-isopropylmalate synthase|nr:hypothetical protein [Parcubacteria group bacterium]|tara:strand:+ start:2756 stop:3385 length:630 start_codon:yes stop_codon:yes gene_type:complete